MKDLSAIPLEELLGDLIDARVDARTCRMVSEVSHDGMPLGAVIAEMNEANKRVEGNLRQIKVITEELARRGITYRCREECP